MSYIIKNTLKEEVLCSLTTLRFNYCGFTLSHLLRFYLTVVAHFLVILLPFMLDQSKKKKC